MPPSFQFDDEDDQPGFFERYRIVIGVVVLLLIGTAIFFASSLFSGKPSTPKPPEMIAIHLLPPPPPPPPRHPRHLLRPRFRRLRSKRWSSSLPLSQTR